MNTRKIDSNHWEIKTKLAKVILDDGVSINDFKIPGNGEYEIGEIEVDVLNNIYIFNIEDTLVVFIAKEKKSLSAEEIKKIGDSHILFIPIEGDNTMDTKTALSIINDVEPEIVIPIFYKDLTLLTKSEGGKITEMSELKITKNDIDMQERKIIILQ